MANYTAEHGGIYKDGQEIVLRGINWFGFEGDKTCLNGLWVGEAAYYKTLAGFVDQMASLGFNAWRIPVSPEALKDANQAPHDWVGNKTSMEVLHDFLKYTHEKGMYVLLDLHNCSAFKGFMDKPGPAIGSCSAYTLDLWRADLLRLADLANHYDNIVGIDLFNEPYGYGWQDWARVAQDAGRAVLDRAPQVLVFIEGVGGIGDQGGHATFWGENLVEARKFPVTLPGHKLVLSPHVYGPSVSGQDYFNAADFPANMPAIWDAHFGTLESQGFSVVIGEWGGRDTGKDAVWEDAFTAYLNQRGIKNFFYWCLNPNSGDTGGLLKDDWKSVDEVKLETIKRLFSAPAPQGAPPPAGDRLPSSSDGAAPVSDSAAGVPSGGVGPTGLARHYKIDIMIGSWPVKGTITCE